MTDITVTNEAPLPNDAAARSPTGEILDRTPTQQPDPALSGTPTAQTSDPKSTTEQSKPTAEGDKPATATAGVPERYDFKAPDNYTLDAKLIDAVTPIFKEAGLSQETAQKLFDFHTNAMIEAAKAPATAVETMRNDWRTKTLADTEISKAVNGDKTGIEAVKLDIGRALTHLPAAEATALKAAMDLTGAGDHPAIVKGWWKMAQLITEGKHVNGGNPSPAGQRAPGQTERPTQAKSMFPNLPG